MKEMYEISSIQDIDERRVVLLKQLHKQEKRLNRDAKVITRKWDRWRNIGSTAVGLLPNISWVSAGWSLVGKLFHRGKSSK